MDRWFDADQRRASVTRAAPARSAMHAMTAMTRMTAAPAPGPVARYPVLHPPPFIPGRNVTSIVVPITDHHRVHTAAPITTILDDRFHPAHFVVRPLHADALPLPRVVTRYPARPAVMPGMAMVAVMSVMASTIVMTTRSIVALLRMTVSAWPCRCVGGQHCHRGQGQQRAADNLCVCAHVHTCTPVLESGSLRRHPLGRHAALPTLPVNLRFQGSPPRRTR